MRLVVQRVLRSSVKVNGICIGSIECGIMVLVGVHQADTEAIAVGMARKLAELRIFEDEQGKMNRSVREIGGSVLAVSNFTLYGDCRKGRRPSFSEAAGGDRAKAIYEAFVSALSRLVPTQSGRFGAEMQVEIINDGPVTLLLDSKID
ncbi:MAG: D-aminoacyl-tRNA deacylase [Armatimonadetes bacterium]|nr:D-aminoacyl-tRNA deacylase [Armatimonadota bacterium]